LRGVTVARDTARSPRSIAHLSGLIIAGCGSIHTREKLMKAATVAGVFCVLSALTACKDHAGGPLPVAPAPSESDFKKDKAEPPPTNTTAATPMTAEQIFSTRCATCHGADGKGNGPASAALNPKPRDYTSEEWQKSVTDEHIKKTIVEGGASVGKSPLMVPNPDLKDQPAVLDGLVHIVRAFRKS
jgi:cytochrome c553